jgi:putative alpha-1,2-mannosidase
MDMWFDDRPLGIPGDEDGGALCSWYVFSAMGFFPVTPGSGMYAIGSPVFNSVRIQLPTGKTFSVIAQNCSKKNKYIQSARLNGKELKTPFIHHTDIVPGGTLKLVMGDRPNKNWGTEMQDDCGKKKLIVFIRFSFGFLGFFDLFIRIFAGFLCLFFSF